MSDPITREETYLAALSGESVNLPDPITREEMYLAAAVGMAVELPNPITRKEQFLMRVVENGGTGGSGTTIRNQDKTITENGEYTADAGYTGLGTIVVSVPQNEGEEMKKTIVNDFIYDTGNLVVSTDTVQIDTGVSIASLSQYEMFGIAFINMSAPWTSVQPNMYIAAPTIKWIICENAGGNVAILRRLVSDVDYFELIRGSATSANNAPLPPNAGHSYSTALTKIYFSDCRGLGNATIKVSWPTQTEERTFRVAIFGIVKKEE